MTKEANQELEWDWGFFHIRPTLRTLPHRISTSSAPQQSARRGVSFNNDAELRNWLDDFVTAKPEDFFKRGIENLPERWEAVVNNGGEYIIDCLIICVKNKLFGSVKKPHERMHQPSTIACRTAGYRSVWVSESTCDRPSPERFS
jgi:hypothetical protein